MTVSAMKDKPMTNKQVFLELVTSDASNDVKQLLFQQIKTKSHKSLAIKEGQGQRRNGRLV